MSVEKDSNRQTPREPESDTQPQSLLQNVVSLNSFRTKKSLSGDRKTGLQDSFQIAPREKMGFTSNNHPGMRPGQDFQDSNDLNKSQISSEEALAERIERLKSSINRINALMEELRSVPDKNLKD